MSITYMNITLIVLFILSILILFIAIRVFRNYNQLVKLKILMEEGWWVVDVFLKKRYDLISDLLEMVERYAVHENGIFENVIHARNMAMNASDRYIRTESENMLGVQLGRLLSVAENYPELRTNQSFIQLQKELGIREDEIDKARCYYNAIVHELNTTIGTFSSNFVAKTFRFQHGIFYEADEKEKEVPDVNYQFGFKDIRDYSEFCG